MGCGASKNKADADPDAKCPIGKPLPLWTSKELRVWLKGHPSLFQYADSQLKGTAGAVFAKVTDEILQDCGITNALHRMQLLIARDEFMNSMIEDKVTGEISVQTITSQSHSHIPKGYMSTDPDSAVREVVQYQLEESHQDYRDENNRSPSGSPCSPSGLRSKSDSTIQPILDYRSSLPKFERQRISGSVDIEGGKYMAMMKVLPSGALIRVVGETLPLVANTLAKQLVELYKLQKVAFYNADNSRRLIKRCCQIQSLFSTRKLKHVVDFSVIRILGEILEEAMILFSLFSDRGWLVRVVKLPHDKCEFQRLDDLLVQSCLMGHINMSEKSKENLKQAPRYTNDVKPISQKLHELGGMEGLRSAQNAADELYPVLYVGRSMLEEAIETELEVYDDSIDNSGPYTVVRNEEMRSFWRRAFPRREHIPWDEFWRRFPRDLKSTSASELSEVLSSRRHRNVLQAHLTRSSPDMLHVSELDFVFVPNVDVPQTVRKLLRVDMELTSIRNSGSQPFPLGEGPIGDGYLFNFPDETQTFMGRDEILMKMALGLQDRGTKIAVIAGSAGTGKKTLAAALGRNLISVGHWTEAYWVDLRGITTQSSAGFQIMSALGILHETSDQQYLFGFLERQQEKHIGVVITGCHDLLDGSEKESKFVDYVENMINASKAMQVILTADQRLKESRPTVLTHELDCLSDDTVLAYATDKIKILNKDVNLQEILSLTTGHPLTIAAVFGVITSGDTSLEEVIQLLQNPDLPDVTTVDCGQEVRAMDPQFRRCLTASLLSMEEGLLNALLVLSIFPSSFVEDTAIHVLGDELSAVKIKSMLKKLCNRGILEYNANAARYDFHVLVRDIARALAAILGIRYEESLKAFVEHYARDVVYLSAKMQKNPWAQKAGLHILQRDIVNVVQVLTLAGGDTFRSCATIFETLLWEMMPLLKERVGSVALQAFCDACKKAAEKCGNDELRIKSLIQEGLVMMDQSRISDAEETLRESLALCLTSIGENTLTTARCYEGLGMILCASGKGAEAVEYYQKNLRVLKEFLGENHLDVAKAHVHIGNYYKSARKHKLALEHYTVALNIRCCSLGEEHPEVASTLSCAGHQTRLTGDTSEAERLLRRCLTIRESGLGEEHPLVGDTLVEVAQILRAAQKFPAAEEMLRRALSIREKCMGPSHPKTGDCVLKLTLLLKAAQKLSAALPLAQRNLQMRQVIYGPAHVEVLEALVMQAEVLLDMGRYADAYKTCKRAFDTGQKQQGSYAPVVTQSLTLLGVIQRQLGSLEEARQSAKCSLESRLASLRDTHPDIATSYNGLAEIELELSMLEDAEEHCREGLRIRQKICKGSHPLVTLSQTTLAGVLQKKEQLDEAESLAREALKIRIAHFGAESPHICRCLDTLSSILVDRREFVEAEEVAHRAVELKRKALGSGHPEVAKSLIGLGVALLEGTKIRAAQSKIARAQDICTTQLGSKHPLTEQAGGLLERCKQTLVSKKSMESL